MIPAGALTRATNVTVLPAALPSGTNTTALVTGTAYEFGPAGTTFAAPVTLTIQYNAASIPSGGMLASLLSSTIADLPQFLSLYP